MGKIVSSFFISLDGVVESPDQWHFPYWSDEMGAVVEAGMQSAAAMLMGRTLYDEWSAYWTSTDTDQEVAKALNKVPQVRRVQHFGEGGLGQHHRHLR